MARHSTSGIGLTIQPWAGARWAALGAIPAGFLGKLGRLWRLTADLTDFADDAKKASAARAWDSAQHSFDRHAAQWFGRDVGKNDKMVEWISLIDRAAGSSKVVKWTAEERLTYAHLARIDGKWFVAQFDRSTGEFVTALVPNDSQVSAMLNLLGK